MLILELFIPIVALFLVGLLFRKFGILEEKDASVLLNIVFYLGFPVVIFQSLSSANIDITTLQIFIFPIILVLLTIFIIFILRKLFLFNINLDKYGSFAVGVTTMNLAFVYPFVEIAYGDIGVSILSILLLSNMIMITSVIYVLAAYFNQSKANIKSIIKKLIFSPLVIALVVGISMNLMNINIPPYIDGMLDSIGSLVTPLLLISLGLKMKFDMNFDVLLVWANLLRFGIGLFVSLMFVMVFGFSDLVEEVLIISSLAPIGYTSLLYADKENLDSNFASIQISVSIIFASIIIPFVIWYLN